ncbi:448_t:CDS:2, partial [Cetraspora pellucida]
VRELEDQLEQQISQSSHEPNIIDGAEADPDSAENSLEKESLSQETNTHLAKQISEASSAFNEVIGDDSGPEEEPPFMKLYFMDMDKATKHESSRNVGHPAMIWLFSMIVSRRNGTDKTNLLANHVLGDKCKYIYKRQKEGSRYIRCDNLIVCDYHLNEPKWAFVRYMYGIIASNPKAPYYENIRFSYISPKQIPSMKSFSPKRSTVIIFEDVCVAPKSIQNHIIPFFTHGRHLIYNEGSSYQDVSKIAGRYTDDVKGTSMFINSYLRKGEFVVFDLSRLEDDPLAIQLRFDIPLNLQKEIEARQRDEINNFFVFLFLGLSVLIKLSTLTLHCIEGVVTLKLVNEYDLFGSKGTSSVLALKQK